uniref:Putative secreted protein n=1 Tax=Ixodes ricinus TaxID=34613 RepID=A0A6B0TYH9_IXORI
MKLFAPLILCISTKKKLLAALTSSKPRTKDFTYRTLSPPRVAFVGGGGFRVVRLKYDALVFSYSLRARWLARTLRDVEAAKKVDA